MWQAAFVVTLAPFGNTAKNIRTLLQVPTFVLILDNTRKPMIGNKVHIDNTGAKKRTIAKFQPI